MSRNARSARRRRAFWARPGVAAALVVILASFTIILILRPGTSRPPRATGCVAGQGVALTTGQAGIAAIIAGVATRRGLPARAVAIAYAAALQESKLANLHYGDLDSVGVFQQRPSEGWGSARKLEDPVYATERFFDALTAVPRYLRLPIYVAAQDVQHSADGTAYAQYAGVGTTMATAFTGTDPHGVWCSFADPAGKASLGAAGRAVSSLFGLSASSSAGQRSMTIPVGGSRQGWAVAAWLVANAGTYGIGHVRYEGYQWLAFTGAGPWTLLTSKALTPGTTSSVEFG